MRKFLDGALQYADGVALAVGLQTPPPDHSEQIGNDPPDNSLMQSVAEAAREAERKAADLLRSVVGGRYGCMDKSLTSYGAEGGVTATNREPTAGNGDGEEGREVMVDEEACKVRVTVLPVTPWGNFTPALNALLSFAAQDRADLVLFQVRGLRLYGAFRMQFLFGVGNLQHAPSCPQHIQRLSLKTMPVAVSASCTVPVISIRVSVL